MTKLTKAQRARLDKLATYLEGLPADYQHFRMATWITDSGDIRKVIQYALHNGGVTECGTAACAAGHGPDAGILVPRRFVTNGYVNWVGYSRLFTGECAQDRNLWCFAGGWQGVDNHHYGAAARIRYLLDKGEPPEDFDDAERRHVRLYAPYRIDAKVPA